MKRTKLLLIALLLAAMPAMAATSSIPPGATSQTVMFWGNCASYSSSDTVIANYVRSGASTGTLTATTLGSTSSGWTSGGFIQVFNISAYNGSTCSYRFDIPNTWLAAGVAQLFVELFDNTTTQTLGTFDVLLDSNATLNAPIVLWEPTITDNGDGTVTVAVITANPSGTPVSSSSRTPRAKSKNPNGANCLPMSPVSGQTGKFTCTMSKPPSGGDPGITITLPASPNDPGASGSVAEVQAP